MANPGGESAASAVGLSGPAGGAGMNLQHERIAALCSDLKLYRIASDWPPMARDAARTEASFAVFLERLLNGETDARGERQRQTLLKLATLPGVKTLEQFDF